MSTTVVRTSTPDNASGNEIEVIPVTTGGGAGDRPVGAIGDGGGTNNFVVVDADGNLAATLHGIAQSLRSILIAIQHPVSQDMLGRNRTFIENAAVSVTGNITTVSGVTAVTDVKTVDELRPGGFSALFTSVLPETQAAWANCVRARIS